MTCVCFPVSLIVLLRLVNIAKKKAMFSLLKLTRNISRHYFSGGSVILNSIMVIHCSAEEVGAEQNWMAVDVRGGAFKIFTLRRS